jgi:hypothetical protein
MRRNWRVFGSGTLVSGTAQDLALLLCGRKAGG